MGSEWRVWAARGGGREVGVRCLLPPLHAYRLRRELVMFRPEKSKFRFRQIFDLLEVTLLMCNFVIS